jgi:thioesterase domain-containing protein
VAVGYHGRPDLTDAAFLKDPYAQRDGARLYRTGDLARRLRDGRLECLGRNDFQVKIRGYRIELGEIELVLAEHEGVRQVVVDVDRSAGEPRLVAYVVANEAGLSAERLVDHARGHLPAYMVPSLVVQLDSLPLTANGKVDRKALRAEGAVPLTPQSHTAPRDDLELRVCAVFEHLLGVSSPSVDESFFDLGGHSLLAVRLARELGAEFGMDISIGTIFERSSVASLAEVIRAGGGKAQARVLSLNRGRAGETPMYFICGIHLYRPLARALGDHQPCYGIFLPEEQQFFEEHNDSSTSVEDLARMYVNSMRSHTPNGPYMLAGVSFGGLLAFEMARQLKAQGEDVPLLVLLDAVLPSAIKRNTRNWLRFQVDELKRTGLRGVYERAERKMRARFAPPPLEPGENDFDRLRRAAYSAAAVAYEATPRTYDGTTVLIRASESDLVGVTVDRQLGWGPKLAGDFKLYQSVGDHLGLLRESLTAEILRRELGTLASWTGRGSSLVPMMAPILR